MTTNDARTIEHHGIGFLTVGKGTLQCQTCLQVTHDHIGHATEHAEAADPRREDVDALALAINPAAFGGRYSSDFDREEARQAARRVLAVRGAAR